MVEPVVYIARLMKDPHSQLFSQNDEVSLCLYVKGNHEFLLHVILCFSTKAH